MEASTGRKGMGTKALDFIAASLEENCGTAPVSPADSVDSRLSPWSKTHGSSIPLLPPPPPTCIEASQEAEKINWGDWSWFDECRAVHSVDVSRSAGCVTTASASGFVRANGVLVLCTQTDADQRTREVVCRPIVPKDLTEGGEAAARLGPAINSSCFFFVRHAGEYSISCRDDPERGITVVVRGGDAGCGAGREPSGEVEPLDVDAVEASSCSTGWGMPIEGASWGATANGWGEPIEGASWGATASGWGEPIEGASWGGAPITKKSALRRRTQRRRTAKAAKAAKA